MASEIFIQDPAVVAVVMENVNDIQTLFSLVLALPIAKTLFENYHNFFLASALRSTSMEIQHLIAAFIVVDEKKPVEDNDLADFYFRYMGHIDLPIPEMQAPLNTLRKLATICAAIETFTSPTEDEALNTMIPCSRGPYQDPAEWDSLVKTHDWNKVMTDQPGMSVPTPQPWSLPAPIPIAHRKKRALWQFEIFCRIFHRPSASIVELDRDRTKAQKMRTQQWAFFHRLSLFEMDELGFVRNYMVDMLHLVYDSNKQHMIWDFDISKFPTRPRDLSNLENFYSRLIDYQLSLGLPYLIKIYREIRFCHDVRNTRICWSEGCQVFPDQVYETGHFLFSLLASWDYNNAPNMQRFNAPRPNPRAWPDTPGSHLNMLCGDVNELIGLVPRTFGAGA